MSKSIHIDYHRIVSVGFAMSQLSTELNLVTKTHPVFLFLFIFFNAKLLQRRNTNPNLHHGNLCLLEVLWGRHYFGWIALRPAAINICYIHGDDPTSTKILRANIFLEIGTLIMIFFVVVTLWCFFWVVSDNNIQSLLFLLFLFFVDSSIVDDDEQHLICSVKALWMANTASGIMKIIIYGVWHPWLSISVYLFPWCIACTKFCHNKFGRGALDEKSVLGESF